MSLLVKILVTEKDLFNFAAQKERGADESSGRKLMRSLAINSDLRR